MVLVCQEGKEKEVQSVEEMQRGMYLDESAKVIRVSYPLGEESKSQPNNFKQVKAIGHILGVQDEYPIWVLHK